MKLIGRPIFYFVFWAVGIMLFGCRQNAQENAQSIFYKSVLGDFSTGSYFIAFDVKGSAGVFTVVLENNTFFDLLFVNMHIASKEKYTQKMFSSLLNNQPFEVDAETEQKIKAYSISKDTTLERLLHQSYNQIKAQYLRESNGRLIVKTTDPKLDKKVIYCLFQRGISARRNDISGLIFINDPASQR